MLAATAWTALAMGLLGGPHCLAMCAAPCGAITRSPLSAHVAVAAPGGEQVLRRLERPSLARTALFHAGRIAGYAVAGALAALAMDRFAWLTQQTSALKPAWTLLHVAVLAWGLLMMLQARQPAWIERAGRGAWRQVAPVIARPGGALAVGSAWALMPCGLLYSALLVAALSGSVAAGAATMALFGLGGTVWLLAGPWAWGRLRSRLDRARGGWGTRLAGLLLCGVAAWALWLDLSHSAPGLWCLP